MATTAVQSMYRELREVFNEKDEKLMFFYFGADRERAVDFKTFKRGLSVCGVNMSLGSFDDVTTLYRTIDKMAGEIGGFTFEGLRRVVLENSKLNAPNVEDRASKGISLRSALRRAVETKGDSIKYFMGAHSSDKEIDFESFKRYVDLPPLSRHIMSVLR